MGGQLTETDLETELVRLDALITGVTASAVPSYTIDGINVDRTAYLSQLRALREQTLERLRNTPCAEDVQISFVDE